MKQNRIVLLAGFFFFSQSLYSQKIMHGIGATISILSGNQVLLRQTSFCYLPRFNLIENSNSSLSIGVPIAVGIGIARNTNNSDAGLGFAYDLPVAFDFNIGCKSTIENHKNFGEYFGVGFGYYHVGISNSSYSNFNGTTYGPIIRSGIRFRLARSVDNGFTSAITMGLFYKMGLEAAKINTFGVNVMKDF
jgi:hypothetical protein